jgi:vacuolar protein sorting-associated protein 13A/C
VTAPVENAKKDGVEGFFKGFGKGIIGVVVKPVTGVLDAATAVASGVRNNTTVQHQFEWIRYPRVFYGPDEALRPYNAEEAKRKHFEMKR